MSDIPKYLGHFEEDGRYVSTKNPPTNPVWTPEKPDTGWTCNPEEDRKSATFTHPRHPLVVFVWDERMDILSGIIVWQSKPYQIQTKPHICRDRSLYSEFMTAMLRLAAIPFNKFNPMMIEVC
uniref:Uncharacterized protein n=1 Tax=Siphoviridae sp. ct89S11 TaxID=2825357 RepID=A0A8S5UR27_9CAUD|nr:MAG TPA: hypothetical protein [Siphoviridae sp. ct89S11]